MNKEKNKENKESQNNNNDNIVNVEFGTPEPNKQEINEQQEILKQQYINMLLNIGQSTYEYALYATKEEYIKHMLELYNYLHPNDGKENKIEVPKKKIILPN